MKKTLFLIVILIMNACSYFKERQLYGWGFYAQNESNRDLYFGVIADSLTPIQHVDNEISLFVRTDKGMFVLKKVPAKSEATLLMTKLKNKWFLKDNLYTIVVIEAGLIESNSFKDVISNRKFLAEYVFAPYELSFFRVYYPPNDEMRHIRMTPSFDSILEYEESIALREGSNLAQKGKWFRRDQRIVLSLDK